MNTQQTLQSSLKEVKQEITGFHKATDALLKIFTKALTLTGYSISWEYEYDAADAYRSAGDLGSTPSSWATRKVEIPSSASIKPLEHLPSILRIKNLYSTSEPNLWPQRQSHSWDTERNAWPKLYIDSDDFEEASDNIRRCIYPQNPGDYLVAIKAAAGHLEKQALPIAERFDKDSTTQFSEDEKLTLKGYEASQKFLEHLKKGQRLAKLVIAFKAAYEQLAPKRAATLLKKQEREKAEVRRAASRTTAARNRIARITKTKLAKAMEAVAQAA